MAKKYDLGKKSDMRRLERDVKKEVEKTTKDFSQRASKSLSDSERSSESAAAAKLRRDTKKSGIEMSSSEAKKIVRDARKER